MPSGEIVGVGLNLREAGCEQLEVRGTIHELTLTEVENIIDDDVRSIPDAAVLTPGELAGPPGKRPERSVLRARKNHHARAALRGRDSEWWFRNWDYIGGRMVRRGQQRP
jgi:hypothetical protein